MRPMLTLTLVFGLLLLGTAVLQPRAILLDVPFGLAFSITELFGYWRPGRSWVTEYRPLAIFCFFVWPIVVSAVVGYTAATISLALWRHVGNRRAWAGIFVLCVRRYPVRTRRTGRGVSPFLFRALGGELLVRRSNRTRACDAAHLARIHREFVAFVIFVAFVGRSRRPVSAS